MIIIPKIIDVKRIKYINDELCMTNYLLEFENEVRIKYRFELNKILYNFPLVSISNLGLGPFSIEILLKAPKDILLYLYIDQINFIKKYKITI